MKITDKMRLDWLSRHTIIEKFWTEDECITRLAAFDQRGNHGTLRQAVDTAIQAERQGRKNHG